MGVPRPVRYGDGPWLDDKSQVVGLSPNGPPGKFMTSVRDDNRTGGRTDSSSPNQQDLRDGESRGRGG